MSKAKVKAMPSPAAKKVHWLAPHMPHISPYLSVRDGMAALAFYEHAFGFKRRFEMKTSEGRLRHGELVYANAVIMLGEPSPEMGRKSPADLGGSPLGLYVYVPDVDSTARRARDAGATIAAEPKDQEYGDRTCEIIDPEGHRWFFATHVKDVKSEELKG
jgi:PhnB protein